MLSKRIVSYILLLIVLSLIVIYSNQPKVTGDFNDTIEDVKEAARLMGLTQVNNFYHGYFLFCLLTIQTFTFGKLQAEFAALNAAGYAIGDRYCTHKVFS